MDVPCSFVFLSATVSGRSEIKNVKKAKKYKNYKKFKRTIIIFGNVRDQELFTIYVYV